MLGVVEAWKPQRFIGSTFEEGPAPKHGVVVVVGLKLAFVSEVGAAGVDAGLHQLLAGQPLLQREVEVAGEAHGRPVAGGLHLQHVAAGLVEERGASAPEAVAAVELGVQPRQGEEVLQGGREGGVGDAPVCL